MRASKKIAILGLAIASLVSCGNEFDLEPSSPVGPEAGAGLQLFRRNASAPLALKVSVYAGEVLPLELRGAAADEIVQWSSSDTGLGAFVKPGELRLKAAGSFQISAQAGDSEISLQISVGERELAPSPAVSPHPLPTPSASPASSPEASAVPSPSPEPLPTPAGMETPSPIPSDPFIDEVVSFVPGSGGGAGSDKLPGIVLGPPQGFGLFQGSLDTVSLGAGGSIVLKSATPILNGSGPDFIIFENAFYANGNPNAPFAELGEVAVSQDGTEFFAFDCRARDASGGYPGCAGVRPVLAHPEWNSIDPSDPETAGGDAFDLSELNLGWARYIRIRDLSEGESSGGNAGFDLDAASIIHQ